MRAGFFIRNLKHILLTSFSTIDVAELRTYDWDGIFPRGDWHGWCDLFGSPYSVLFDTGPQTRESGWIYVMPLGRLPINAKLTGAAADAAGTVQLIFEGAMSLYDTMIRDTPTDMQFIADVSGNTEVETHGIIDVHKWNYIRLQGVNNMSNRSVNVRLVTHDGVRPMNLPEGTGV